MKKPSGLEAWRSWCAGGHRGFGKGANLLGCLFLQPCFCHQHKDSMLLSCGECQQQQSFQAGSQYNFLTGPGGSSSVTKGHWCGYRRLANAPLDKLCRKKSLKERQGNIALKIVLNLNSTTPEKNSLNASAITITFISKECSLVRC